MAAASSSISVSPFGALTAHTRLGVAALLLVGDGLDQVGDLSG